MYSFIGLACRELGKERHECRAPATLPGEKVVSSLLPCNNKVHKAVNDRITYCLLRTSCLELGLDS